MGTFLVFFLGLVIIAGLLFLLASFAFGRGEEMAPAPPDSTPVELPDDRPVRGDDVRAVRLSVAARGYRMREVDWVLEQLAVALDDRDRELAELRRTADAPAADAPASAERSVEREHTTGADRSAVRGVANERAVEREHTTGADRSAVRGVANEVGRADA